MKQIFWIVKLVVALSALAAAIYAIATYGDEVVAFCKKVKSVCPCKKCKSCEAPVEAPAAEETAAETAPETAPAEAPAADASPVAEDADFVQ